MLKQTPSTKNVNVDALEKFIWLLEEAKFYNAASVFLSDSFVFSSDDFTTKSKHAWLIHCSTKQYRFPDFGRAMNGEHANQVIRMGTTSRLGLPRTGVKQVIQFDSQGKIESISIEQQELLSTLKSRLRLALASTSRKTTLVATLSLPEHPEQAHAPFLLLLPAKTRTAANCSL